MNNNCYLDDFNKKIGLESRLLNQKFTKMDDLSRDKCRAFCKGKDAIIL